ncbi:MAG TPA: DUF5681 domain-containing protein [Aromatoleum sp.]|uniref:DUF5681 domain-containing protein n=1 Tax=Aromatoleum sp. TaxID=2307007 RepID=UPI002B467215|nr:DUF5681 domain-containing protein [Aromatoleum sp.]HJV26317.1 DUF5681 domain-containing protein [Aromatoleum sp.]
MSGKRAGPWQPGQSGNPKGRPRGSRNRATLLALAAMEGDLTEIVGVVLAAARGGDLVAARLVLERLVPPMRDRPVTLDLPDTSTLQGVSAAQAALVAAVAAGELTPVEADTLTGIVEARRKALETEELDARVRALEEKQ